MKEINIDQLDTYLNNIKAIIDEIDAEIEQLQLKKADAQRKIGALAKPVGIITATPAATPKKKPAFNMSAEKITEVLTAITKGGTTLAKLSKALNVGEQMATKYVNHLKELEAITVVGKGKSAVYAIK